MVLLLTTPLQVPCMDLTLKAGRVGKVIAVHVTKFSDHARCLHQCLSDKDRWNQRETSDGCLLVGAEAAVHLREDVIK